MCSVQSLWEKWSMNTDNKYDDKSVTLILSFSGICFTKEFFISYSSSTYQNSFPFVIIIFAFYIKYWALSAKCRSFKFFLSNLLFFFCSPKKFHKIFNILCGVWYTVWHCVCVRCTMYDVHEYYCNVTTQIRLNYQSSHSSAVARVKICFNSTKSTQKEMAKKLCQF